MPKENPEYKNEDLEKEADKQQEESDMADIISRLSPDAFSRAEEVIEKEKTKEAEQEKERIAIEKQKAKERETRKHLVESGDLPLTDLSVAEANQQKLKDELRISKEIQAKEEAEEAAKEAERAAKEREQEASAIKTKRRQLVENGDLPLADLTVAEANEVKLKSEVNIVEALSRKEEYLKLEKEYAEKLSRGENPSRADVQEHNVRELYLKRLETPAAEPVVEVQLEKNKEKKTEKEIKEKSFEEFSKEQQLEQVPTETNLEKFSRNLKKNLEKQIEELIKDAEKERGVTQDKTKRNDAGFRLAHYQRLKVDLNKDLLDVAYEVMEERNRLGDEVEAKFRKERAGNLDAKAYEAERKLANFKIGNYWTPAIELAEMVTERNFKNEFDEKMKQLKAEYDSAGGEEARIAKKLEEIKKQYGEDLSNEAILQRRYGWRAETPKGPFGRFIYRNKAEAVELEVPVVFGRKLDAEVESKIEKALKEEILKEIESEKESKAREFQRYQVQEFMKLLENRRKVMSELAGTNSRMGRGVNPNLIGKNKGLEGIDLTKRAPKVEKPTLATQIDNGEDVSPERIKKKMQGTGVANENLRRGDKKIPTVNEITTIMGDFQE